MKHVDRENSIYESLYGDIPNTILERIKYILGKKANNEKFNKGVEVIAKKIKRIKWKTISFTMYKVFKPSARPRANTRMGFIRMYVPRAKENADWVTDYMSKQDFEKIKTPCKFDVTFYEKTPSGLSILKSVLAEMGFIRPWKRTGDVDNYSKTILDALQHNILEDDCLVIEMNTKLYYSIKPRCEVNISYMEKYPEI